MRSAAVLALLLCAGQVPALPVNSPMNKGDTKVMKCVVEVISDSLSKPSPVPVSHECLETLQRDERILSILRHQNLLKELQDLALQGAKERAQQQKEPSSFEDELSEVLENQSMHAKPEAVTSEPSSKDAMEKREDSKEAERNGSVAEGGRPQAFPEPEQGPPTVGNEQGPGEEEATPSQSPATVPSQKHPGPQATVNQEGPSQGLADREKGPSTEQGQPARRGNQEGEEEDVEEEEAGEKAVSEEEGLTTAPEPQASRGYQETRKGPSQSQALAVDEAGKTSAVKAPTGERPRSLHREQQQEEEEEEEAAAAARLAGAPGSLFPGGKSGELRRQEEQLAREWEEAKRWSKMEQLAQELTAEKRLDGEAEDDAPDGSMKLSLRARAYGFRGPGPRAQRGWRPPSREDSVEEKKEEEGSANRRAEDQELESLSAIEAELEKVAHQLQVLRRG